MNGRMNGHHPPETAIVIEGLGKRYRIGAKEEQHDTMMQSALAWLSSPLVNYRRLRNLSRFEDGESEDTFWALRDVSLTVEQGEVLGVIGRNGAGKSTLLKVLSRITPPTTGRIIMNGRVSSLLEVGTGFHPELTGRENVYLNGTILGMSRSEIDRKFDEIVAFSEVERFIDTPVKRYSSGMRVRLAFAVSAHLESELLLVDEVLAVGDAAFQQKCLDKMGGVAKSGRTVLFVSHNMQVIQQLCDRSVLLRDGRLIASGPTAEVVDIYLEDALTTAMLEPVVLDETIRIKDIQVTQRDALTGEFIDNNDPFRVHVKYDILRPLDNLLLGFNVAAADGTNIFRTYDMLTYGMGEREAGAYESVFELPGGLLQSGHYSFEVIVGIHRLRWLSRGDIRLRLNMGGSRATDVDFPGIVSPVGQWTVLHNGHR